MNNRSDHIRRKCSWLQLVLPDVWPETVGGKKTVLLATSTRAGGAGGVCGDMEDLVASLVADSSGLAAWAGSADRVASAGDADTSRAKSWRIWTLMNWGSERVAQDGSSFSKTWQCWVATGALASCFANLLLSITLDINLSTPGQQGRFGCQRRFGTDQNLQVASFQKTRLFKARSTFRKSFWFFWSTVTAVCSHWGSMTPCCGVIVRQCAGQDRSKLSSSEVLFLIWIWLVAVAPSGGMEESA